MIGKWAVTIGACAVLTISTAVPAGAVSVPAADPGSAGASALKDCPLLIAHRGGVPPDYATIPENSMAAFERAASLGVWSLETDVFYTKDGHAIIMHDKSLDRTTNGKGLVADHTLAEIEQLRLVTDHDGVRNVTDQKVPTLQQVLDFAVARNVNVLPEYKDAEDDSLIHRYINQLNQSGAKTIVGGFSKKVLNEVHGLDPSERLMWFHLGNGVGPADVPEGANAGFLSLLINKAVVTAMNNAGVKMDGWFNVATGGDDQDGWKALTEAGVTWITTDLPKEYKEWTATTDTCIQRPKIKQIAPCAEFPNKVRRDRKVVVLDETCKTSADQTVSVKARSGKKGSFAVVMGKHGKVKIKTKDTRSTLRIMFKAPGTDSFNGYDRHRIYKVR